MLSILVISYLTMAGNEVNDLGFSFQADNDFIHLMNAIN